MNNTNKPILSGLIFTITPFSLLLSQFKIHPLGICIIILTLSFSLSMQEKYNRKQFLYHYMIVETMIIIPLLMVLILLNLVDNSSSFGIYSAIFVLFSFFVPFYFCGYMAHIAIEKYVYDKKIIK